MQRAIRSSFFKFRVFFGALRAGVYGFALVCAGWIFLAPASQTEIARLDLMQNSSADTSELAVHRMAKLLTLVGTDRIYEMVAARMDNGTTADQVRLNILIAAEGRPLTADDDVLGMARSSEVTDVQTGAKFVAARTN